MPCEEQDGVCLGAILASDFNLKLIRVSSLTRIQQMRILLRVAVGLSAFTVGWSAFARQFNPVVIGELQGRAVSVAVSGEIAYVANAHGGVLVVDVSNRDRPIVLHTIETSDFAAGVAVVDDLLYVTLRESGLQIFDVVAPFSPLPLGCVDTPGIAVSVFVVGDTAYVTDWGVGVQIIDISDPMEPAIITAIPTPEDATAIAVDGDIGFITFNKFQMKNKLSVVFQYPEIIQVECNMHSWMKAWIVVADSTYYALTDKDGSFKIENIPPGTYKLRLWHESLGEKVKEVVVKSAEDLKVDFKLIKRSMNESE